MKCANHPGADSVAFCGLCGRALCPECRRDVRGMVVCESCLAARVQASPLPPIIGLGSGPNPGLALDYNRYQSYANASSAEEQLGMLRKVCPRHFVTTNNVGAPLDTIDLRELCSRPHGRRGLFSAAGRRLIRVRRRSTINA